MLFSSPLGDGLVLGNSLLVLADKDFRPRVGMGWFFIVVFIVIILIVFVPAWGWVGSYAYF